MYHRICHGALQKPGGASPGLILVKNIIKKKKSQCQQSDIHEKLYKNKSLEIDKDTTYLGSGVHKAVSYISLVLAS